MAGIKPTKITFLNQDRVTGKSPLTDSHFSSLDNESYFTHGNPEQALVVGPVNAQVTFFDDQEYRTGQNALLVSLKREGTEANPVNVDVAYARLGPDDHPNGVYSGEEDDFGWILYKVAERDWVENTLRVAGDFVDLVSGVIGKIPGATTWSAYVTVAGIVVSKLQGFETPGHSNNSQVDNISSVLFGTFEG